MNSQKTVVLILSLATNFNLMAASEEAEQLFQTALLKNQSGLFVDASVLLTDAISLDDQQARLFYQRGLSFFGMNQHEHGIKDFNTAVDLKTRELGVYLQLIKYYKAKQQYLAILVVTDQLIANLPAQAPGAYHDKALAFEAMQLPQQALTAYQQVVKLMVSDDASSAAFKQQVINKIAHIKQQLEQQP